MISTIAAAARDQRRRRMLLPISTLLAAVTIAGVSGANFNASTANPLNSYSTGTFTMTNSRSVEDNTHIFQAENLKPGDTVTGSVTITNSGTLPALLEVTETATNGFVDPANLNMVIEEDDVEIYDGPFGDFDGEDLGEWEAGEDRTYDFAVQLALSATVTEQGKTATASYTWDSVQVNDGDAIDGQFVEE